MSSNSRYNRKSPSYKLNLIRTHEIAMVALKYQEKFEDSSSLDWRSLDSRSHSSRLYESSYEYAQSSQQPRDVGRYRIPRIQFRPRCCWSGRGVELCATCKVSIAPLEIRQGSLPEMPHVLFHTCPHPTWSSQPLPLLQNCMPCSHQLDPNISCQCHSSWL